MDPASPEAVASGSGDPSEREDGLFRSTQGATREKPEADSGGASAPNEEIRPLSKSAKDHEDSGVFRSTRGAAKTRFGESKGVAATKASVSESADEKSNDGGGGGDAGVRSTRGAARA